jgi:hypothetical protein
MSPPGRLRRRLALFFFLKIRRAVSQGKVVRLAGLERRKEQPRRAPFPERSCRSRSARLSQPPPWIRCHSLSQHRGCRPGTLGCLCNDCLRSTRGSQLIRQLRLEQLHDDEAYKGDDDVLDHECGAGAGCRMWFDIARAPA